MSKQFQKVRIYTSATMLVIMAGLGIGMMVMLHSERSAISNTAGSNVTEDVRTADTLKIARFANENEEIASIIKANFQPATDTVMLIEHFEETAGLANVSVTINKAEKGGEGSAQYLLIDADLEGSWNNVYEFLHELDRFAYKHETERISLTKIGIMSANNWLANVVMRVTLNQ